MEGQAGLSELSVISQVSTVHKHLSYAQTDTSVIYTNAKTKICSDTAIPYHLSLFRKLKMPDTVSVVVPVEGSPNKVMALIGRKICLVDRETGAQ